MICYINTFIYVSIIFIVFVMYNKIFYLLSKCKIKKKIFYLIAFYMFIQYLYVFPYMKIIVCIIKAVINFTKLFTSKYTPHKMTYVHIIKIK